MPRYAELPGGKRLSFDDKATDREIQRAVRRELGLEQGDLIEAVEAMTQSVASLGKRIDSANKDMVDGVTTAIKQLTTSQDQATKDLAKDLVKAMDHHSQLAGVLGQAVTALNSMIERVSDQSKAELERTQSTAEDAAKTNEAAAKRMENSVNVFIHALQKYEDIRRSPKKVRRLADGSFSIDVDRRQS